MCKAHRAAAERDSFATCQKLGERRSKLPFPLRSRRRRCAYKSTKRNRPRVITDSSCSRDFLYSREQSQGKPVKDHSHPPCRFLRISVPTYYVFSPLFFFIISRNANLYFSRKRLSTYTCTLPSIRTFLHLVPHLPLSFSRCSQTVRFEIYIYNFASYVEFTIFSYLISKYLFLVGTFIIRKYIGATSCVFTVVSLRIRTTTYYTFYVESIR